VEILDWWHRTEENIFGGKESRILIRFNGIKGIISLGLMTNIKKFKVYPMLTCHNRTSSDALCFFMEKYKIKV